MVALRDLENLHALLQREGIDVTMFTDWFELNKRDPPVRTITYAEIPEYYVWHEKPKLWKRGKQQRCIGKTFLYKTIIARLRSERRIVLAATSLGIASLLFPSGRTTHSNFDEAMTQKYAFEALDKTLRDILGYKNPEKRSRILGGLAVLLGGDFR
nr:DNA helicase PIF1, ATP-dependent [Tanacetum cinerariifolium]